MTCPHCKRTLAQPVPFCPYCAKEILFPCPHCKAYIDPQEFVCPHCGRRRDEQPPSRLAQSEAAVPILAAQTRPRLLASKIVQDNYPPFFNLTPNGPAIGAFLFGAEANHRSIAAATTFAAFVQLAYEGFCTLLPDEPKSAARLFYPVPGQRWDGQTDSLETLLFRHSGQRADEVVEAILRSLYSRTTTITAPSVGQQLTNLAIGRGMGIAGIALAANQPTMKSEVYDDQVLAKLHLLVHDCSMPTPPDLAAACAQVYNMMLQYYQYDPEGAVWLAHEIAGQMV